MIAPSNVILRDGSSVTVREYADSDYDKLKDFIYSVSDNSIVGRFMDKIPREEALESLLRKGSLSLIGIRGEKIVAHGSVCNNNDNSAEIGIIVSDAFQSGGLGTAILDLLAEFAFRSGVNEIRSYVSPENYRMISVMKNLGFAIESEVKPGTILVKFSPSLLPEAIEHFENRDAVSAVNAVKIFLEPKSVAVIGASNNKNSIGGKLLSNLIEDGFKGPIFPVNPTHDSVQGLKCYKAISDVESKIDVAFVVVHADLVAKVADECGRAGVRGLVIISSGFSEVGEEGKKRQEVLSRICEEYGMRVIGPNCMGVVNTSDRVSMNGQFSAFKSMKGRIAFLSQSGALGIAIIDITSKLGLGMSSFVSVGNKEDISANDLVQYWENDENTDVILFYLESFDNPVKFSRVARRVTKKKPVVAVKSGRSKAAFRATQSHTGALLEASDVTVDALFKQSGVIRAETLDDMFEITSVLAHQPIPKGNRVAILSNAGGAGILAADACESNGLRVPEFSNETKEKLRSILPPIAGIRNPVDMSAAVGPEGYEKALDILGKLDEIDSIIIIFIPPIIMDQNIVGSRIINAAKRIGKSKTLVSVFMAYRGVPETLKGEGVTIPSFPFPEDAAYALSRAVEYGKWKYAETRKVRNIEVGEELVKATISKALAQNREWLSYEESNEILTSYGIPTVKTVSAKDATELKKKIGDWTGKVAIKAYGPKLIHKSDVGAVKLGIDAQESVKETEKMISSLNERGYQVDYAIVQEMVPEGIEMIAGSTHDPIFGPLVVAGMGGKLVELIRDISTRLAPVSDIDTEEMLSELKTSQVLYGYRGGMVADVNSYRDIIFRVSKLVYDNPEILELDLNPIIVLEESQGSKAVDFRIRVGASSNEVTFAAKSIMK